ncbi:hypothetical protein [Bremerella cremea]
MKSFLDRYKPGAMATTLLAAPEGRTPTRTWAWHPQGLAAVGN